MSRIEQCFELETIENQPGPKVPVIKLKNPRWGGWAVYHSWEDAHEVIGDLLKETWEEETSYPTVKLPPLWDEYQIEMDYMTEDEIDALMPLVY